MNAPLARGACPALAAPMQTGDGLLVRLNSVAAGFLSPAALSGVADAAFRHGNGIVEVTARGSVQMRGLAPATVGPLAEDVDALGISPRTGLPVETPALAGLDPVKQPIRGRWPWRSARRSQSPDLPPASDPRSPS